MLFRLPVALSAEQVLELIHKRFTGAVCGQQGNDKR